MIKDLLKKPHIILIGLGLMIGLLISGKNLLNNGQGPDSAEAAPPRVKTVRLELNGAGAAARLETVGTVKAGAKVAASALARGTARGVFFAVGDEVFPGQTLATLADSLVLSGLISAETNFANMQNNLFATERLAAEGVRQAELGVEAARGNIEAAEISLAGAKSNLDNYLALRDKTGEDAKANAVAAFPGYLNSVFSALDQINLVIRADEAELRPSAALLDPAIGAKDLDSLPYALASYRAAKSALRSIEAAVPAAETIKTDLAGAISALEKTKTAIDAMIGLLDNSVGGPGLDEAAINAQKTGFVSLKNSMLASISGAKSTLQSLENIGLINTREESGLKDAIAAAENRLGAADTAYRNALVSLENARQATAQQKLAAKITLDGARAQLDLARIQAGDLAVKAPIGGTISGKFVELGMEVAPGMKIAEISQTDLLTIEADIGAADVFRITVGQNAVLEAGGRELAGAIAKIFPGADPSTRKVRIEIAYDNRGGELIPGLFVDVKIPLAGDHSGPRALFVPLRAVTIDTNENYAFVVREGRAEKTELELGEIRNAEIEVLKGLADGDELIVDGAKLVEDGEAVIIID